MHYVIKSNLRHYENTATGVKDGISKPRHARSQGRSAERVLEAAEALRQRLGKIPTVEQVRQELGAGSPSRIGDIMRPWRASLEPAVPVTAANDQVTKTLKTLTDLLCADITRHYQDRTERLTADNSTFQKELGRLEEDAIARQR